MEKRWIITKKIDLKKNYFQGNPGIPGRKGESGRDGLPGLPNWVINDKGYCILAVGNCPPGFSQIQAYQSTINQYKFGDYFLVKTNFSGIEQKKFSIEIHACCRWISTLKIMKFNKI